MRPHHLLLAALLLSSFGCVQYHYSPNFVQTPFLDQKGQGMISAGVSGSPTSINGDFHVSYSPVKHGTVMVNFFKNHSSYETSDFFGGNFYRQTANGYLLEGAVGGYTSLGFGTGALYAGWGQGSMHNDYGIQRYADLRLQRFFIQPTYTFKNDWFRLGMGLRLVRLSYPSGEIDSRIDGNDLEIIHRLENETPIWFPELGGNIGVHFKPITITASLVIIASRPAVDYGLDASNIGLGITYELEHLGKKRKKTTTKD